MFLSVLLLQMEMNKLKIQEELLKQAIELRRQREEQDRLDAEFKFQCSFVPKQLKNIVTPVQT